MVEQNVNKTKKNDVANKVASVVKAYHNSENLKTDPNGSYTGVPCEKYDKPVQDADDL